MRQIPKGPGQRVSEMQAKLHRWAAADEGRRFDDLFNFVYDPATLIVASDRVTANWHANTPDADGLRAVDIEQQVGVPGFLGDLRAQLKQGTFRPLQVRERTVPKPGGSGKVRKLGIPVRTRSPRSTITAPTDTDGCSMATSRRALTPSRTRP